MIRVGERLETLAQSGSIFTNGGHNRDYLSIKNTFLTPPGIDDLIHEQENVKS
jgi:hypothetical protein